MRRLAAGLVVVALALALAVTFETSRTESTAANTAVAQAMSAQPQARWFVDHQTFELWANDVARGSMRLSGGSGPAWIVELAAPADSTWSTYRAVVIVNALTGAVSGSEVVAAN